MAVVHTAVMALDPSLRGTGVAVFQHHGDGTWGLVHYQVIDTKAEAKKRGIYKGDDMTRRIQLILRELREVVQTYKPVLMVAELTPGGSKNSSAAAALAIAKAITLSVSEYLDIPLQIFVPDDVKQHVGGRKDVSKTEIKDWVAARYPQLVKPYSSKTAKDGWNGKFEHIADAVVVFELARCETYIKLLEKS